MYSDEFRDPIDRVPPGVGQDELFESRKKGRRDLLDLLFKELQAKIVKFSVRRLVAVLDKGNKF